MEDVLIAADKLVFHYDETRPLLSGADFSLARGDRVVLSGGNGSGKTSFLRLLVGLARPIAGTIVAFGHERRQESDFFEVRRRAGLVFQDPDDQLFCPTVLEDVAFGPLNLGVGHDRAIRCAEETLRQLGIAQLAERPTYQLSGGEERMVSIGTVLAMDPDVLLLDEPLAGLDDDAQRCVLETLSGLAQSMIIVSHERTLLDALATRIVRLSDGRFVDHEA
jgi:cobalt/nickel transport system ATP-binding protein